MANQGVINVSNKNSIIRGLLQTLIPRLHWLKKAGQHGVAKQKVCAHVYLVIKMPFVNEPNVLQTANARSRLVIIYLVIRTPFVNDCRSSVCVQCTCNLHVYLYIASNRFVAINTVYTCILCVHVERCEARAATGTMNAVLER